MSEFYSKAEDCYELAKKLRKGLKNKIDFVGAVYTDIPYGKYLSSFRRNNGEYIYHNSHSLPFYYKFSKNEFLRIGIGGFFKDNTLGEKLAALSDFYEILHEDFGEPTIFYTTKDDEEGYLNLEWAFANKEEEIKNFKSGNYFGDAEIDTLIIIDEKKDNNEEHSLSEKTRKFISKQIGLPFALLSLVDKDIENFMKHKMGMEIMNENDYSLSVSENKLERKLTK